jgi:hypothetical protein
MLFIILISFLVLAFRDFSSLRSHFRPSLGTERKPVRGYAEMCSRRVESPAQLARRGGRTPFGVSSRSVEAEPLIPPDGAGATDGFLAGVRRRGYPTLERRFAALCGRVLAFVLNYVCIGVIRAIRGEIISAFPRRAFGKRDRRAKGPRSGRA